MQDKITLKFMPGIVQGTYFMKKGRFNRKGNEITYTQIMDVELNETIEITQIMDLPQIKKLPQIMEIETYE